MNQTSSKLTFFSVKGFITQMKRQASDQKKIFASHIAEKELVSKTHKQPSKLNSKKINNLINEWAKLKLCVLKEDIQIAKQSVENCLTSLVIREMKIKSTLRCHYTL